jgi:two-component system LytT family response regulator
MRVIVIDDENQGRELLISILKKEFSELTIVAEASTAFDARIMILEHKPDLVFLDINMPMLNGFDLIQSFANKSFYFIIVSAYNTYAVDALKHGAVGYILKPIIIDELRTAILNAKKIIEAKNSQVQIENIVSKPKSIILNTHKGTDVIVIDEILYVYAQINYIDVYLLDGTKHNYAKTLKSFNELLPDSTFLRVHKSCTVNINYIISYDKINKNITLKDGIKIPVSRSKQVEVFRLLNK